MFPDEVRSAKNAEPPPMQGDVTTYVYLTFQKTTLFVFKALFMLKFLDPPFARTSEPQGDPELGEAPER